MKVFTSREHLRNAISDYFDGIDRTTDIGTWDTSQITDMSELFDHLPQISVEPIVLNWNTSNVKNMNKMFNFCKQDFILNFDTSKVTDMSMMFYNATNFNQPINFNTCKVTDMSWMFCNAQKFNQPLQLNICNVIDMNGMFSWAFDFNQPLNFDTSNVKSITNMFYRATHFNHSIYFNRNICDHTFVWEAKDNKYKENKYVLESGYYYKLILFSILNKINPELLFCCDGFEDYC